MSIYSLFNIPVTHTREPGGSTPSKSYGPELSSESASAEPTIDTVGAFVTPQSLVSFAGATGVISTLWTFVKALVPLPIGAGTYVLAILSFVVGALIYWINTNDPKSPAPDAKGRLIAIAIAVLNTIILFNASRAAVGI